MAVVRHRRKFRPTTDPLPRGAGQPKSAGDGHYLYLQTQFGEYRCTQFRVIMFFYKAINGEVVVTTDDLGLEMADIRTRAAHCHKFKEKRARTNLHGCCID